VKYIWEALILTLAVPVIGQADAKADCRATLQKLVSGSPPADLRAFYEPAAYDPAWVRGGRPTAQAYALIQAFRSAAAKGLNPDDYDASLWPARLDELGTHSSEAVLARFDLALTLSAMRYVSDLHIGKVNPRLFHSGFDLVREQYDLPGFIRTRLTGAVDVAAALNTIEPPFPGYWRTQTVLRRYLALAAEDGMPKLAPVRSPIDPGSEYPDAAKLGRLLRLLGDLPADAVVTDGRYQGDLVDAVKHFQSRHGLDADGRIGAQTFRHLNTPLSTRARQLALTLERYRWVPHQFAVQPIVVNIPEFRLRAFDASYRTELEMKVVVGRAYGHKTPVFASEMKSVVFRPYWEVPLGIQRNEIVPKVLRDRSYLARNGYEVLSPARKDAGRAIDDSALTELRSGNLRIRQVPGPDNALGLVTFRFPNEYNVYMHGTPAAQLFAKSRRDFSHGCIRLEKPEALAALVLRDKPGWNSKRIAEAMYGAETITVTLDHPIPVLIVYATAVVQENGDVHFFDDIYGHDATLEKALAAATRISRLSGLPQTSDP
jgi:murein L,D-transpeptidase YcbB/YkuD